MSEQILDAKEPALKAAQGKITYLGEQTAIVKTVVFSSTGLNPVMEQFAPFQRGRTYTNDNIKENLSQFTVTPREFERLLAAVKPILSNPNISKGPDFLSFCVVQNPTERPEGREFKINRDNGRAFHDALAGALEKTNDAGRDAMKKQNRLVFPG